MTNPEPVLRAAIVLSSCRSQNRRVIKDRQTDRKVDKQTQTLKFLVWFMFQIIFVVLKFENCLHLYILRGRCGTKK